MSRQVASNRQATARVSAGNGSDAITSEPRGAEASPSAPSVWPIIVDAFANAPRYGRQTAWFVIAGWMGLVALQAIDSSNAPGLSGVAEFFSAIFAASGGLLVGAAWFLESAAGRRTLLTRAEAADQEALRRVLFALPALGVAAGALMSAAVALMIVRALLGTSLLFVVVITAFYSSILWFAVATVLRSTRTLYVHAVAEASAAARARAEAGEAHLEALKARMNPHFLFNALNTVAALVRSDPIAAERVTENLSSVLRMTLDRSTAGGSTIGDEIAYARAYFAVEQMRWGDRLRVSWDVDASVLTHPIQPLVLQPLLENALHHGIGARLDGGVISITITRDSPHVALSVADDGEGFPAVVTERIGLGNLRQRLASAYGGRASLEIDPNASGARVTVRVPLQQEYGHASPHR